VAAPNIPPPIHMLSAQAIDRNCAHVFIEPLPPHPLPASIRLSKIIFVPRRMLKKTVQQGRSELLLFKGWLG
jgi:hypothetical protein